jgi:hypothetical protein
MMKEFLVTRRASDGAGTNRRVAPTAEDAAIIESKLYESDDLVLLVREVGTEVVQELRVVSRLSHVVTDVTPVPAAVG